MVDSKPLFNRRRWVAMSAGLLGMGAAWFAPPAHAAEAAALASVSEPPPTAAPRAIGDLGVELTAVRLAASDFLIDLRYRVKDVAKAQPLLERKLHPVLVNEATGDRFYVPQAPKVGELRQSATSKQPAIVDRVYFVLFANPDRKLKSGEKVTLYAGDSVVKDLVVQ
jgi:hypothetical protein